MNQMTAEQALGLLAQVCAIYRGTAEEHDNLKMALNTINEAIKPKVGENITDGSKADAEA